MSARVKGRKRAADLLYAADVRQVPVRVLIDEENERAQREPDRLTSWRFALTLVNGYLDNADDIDGLIAKYSDDWALDRMPVIDRALTRIALWEIRYASDIPISVAISEAVKAAREFSTERSGRFIGGLLDRIAASEPPVVPKDEATVADSRDQ